MKTKILTASLVHSMTKILIAVCFMVLAFSSCKKENNDEDDKLSNTEMLCREWKVISINDTSVWEWDEYYELLYGFEADGDFRETSNYGVDDIEIAIGTWEWEYNEESIWIESEDDNFGRIIIIKLTKNELWFEFEYGTTLIKCVPK